MTAFAPGGAIDRQDTGTDAVPVTLGGCAYLLPRWMVAALVAMLPPVPPAHP